MTRQAALEGFERFVNDAIEQTAREFSVSRAIGGQQGGLLDRLSDSEIIHEAIVKPELERYRQQTVAQFRIILDYVESTDPIDNFRDELLDTGGFSEAIRNDLPEDRRSIVHDRLLERHRSLGMGIKPIVSSDRSDFWEAVVETLTYDEANALVEDQFVFTDPIVEHRDAFNMKVSIDPTEVLGGIFGGSEIEIEYTDEALRAMRHAEQAVIDGAKAEISTRFGE